jgi:DNA-binding XRE family transcriptional regulator
MARWRGGGEREAPSVGRSWDGPHEPWNVARSSDLQRSPRGTLIPFLLLKLRGVDLKAERVRAGLTQRDLGERIGVSGRRVSNVEGQFRPAESIVRRILEALAASDVKP